MEFKRYELSGGASLPVGARGKVFMRQARLSKEQSSKVTTWLAGEGDEDAVVKALLRLDTNADESAMLVGQSAGSKNLWVDEYDLQGEDIDYTIRSRSRHRHCLYTRPERLGGLGHRSPVPCLRIPEEPRRPHLDLQTSASRGPVRRAPPQGVARTIGDTHSHLPPPTASPARSTV